MIKVAVLGSTGMLGSSITRVLENESVTVYEFNRSGISITKKNHARKINAITDFDFSEVFSELKIDYIVNCIGMIKQVINPDEQSSVDLAYKINSNFPLKLNIYAKSVGIPVIQIGTDCVYSGKEGLYSEDQPHDPSDIYGLTKELGEQSSTCSMILRCSIIGKELSSANSLLSWVLSNPNNSSINGYTNHFWNGVTTQHFSQVVHGIIKSSSFKHGIFHLVPKNIVTKYDLVNSIAKHFDRSDLRIRKFEAESMVNRSLITNNLEQNLSFWQNGGYNEIPSIEEMVSSYAVWIKTI